jgi:thiamine biosynthesis lipoprotein
MGTIVTIHVVSLAHTVDAAIDRAFQWFHEIEQRCTRFNQQSELMQLCAQPGVSIPVSAILFEAIQFALLVAEESGGAFDPTVGHRLAAATWRDIVLDPAEKTITLHRPLTLDLGAVAKGLAVDTAASELAPFTNFSIDAGGDLYLGGTNERGLPWSVGIRHPREDAALIATILASNQAVCTSGDYERRLPNNPSEHHILDPRTGTSGQHCRERHRYSPHRHPRRRARHGNIRTRPTTRHRASRTARRRGPHRHPGIETLRNASSAPCGVKRKISSRRRRAC